MPNYRCNHKIEAVQWSGENYEAIREMHRRRTGRDPKLEEGDADGRIVVLMGEDWHGMRVGEWLAWSHDELIVYADEVFGDEYEEYDGEV